MTDIEKVRLRIGDTAGTIFTDPQIQDFLDENDDDILLAAADACEALAADAVKLHKAQSIGRYSIDRKGLADTYMALAKELRARAGSETPAYGVVEQAVSDFAASEIVDNEAMRGS